MKDFIFILLFLLVIGCKKESTADLCESCLISLQVNNVKYTEDGIFLGVGDEFEDALLDQFEEGVVNVDAGIVKIEVPNEYAKVCEDFIELEVVLSLRATITSGLFEGVKTTIEYPHTFSEEEIDNALCLD